MTYRRPPVESILRRVKEPRRFIQVLAGPRQVGKSTIARQVLEELKTTSRYASADDPGGRDLTWLRDRSERVRDPSPSSFSDRRRYDRS
jgi:predicted AAA+ superfamily ATPase